MIKITANDSHKRDDLADCMYDCLKIALIDKTLYIDDTKSKHSSIVQGLAQHNAERIKVMRDSYY
jgi:hypothetical protein